VALIGIQFKNYVSVISNAQLTLVVFIN